jgi:serine phosphatase RsbU (regulator of sigma subunit)
MVKRTKLIIIILSLFCFGASAAPLSYIDSLKEKCKNEPDDTVKVKLLNKIAWYFNSEGSASEEALNSAQQASELSQKLNYATGESYAHIGLGGYYQLKGDNENALHEFLNALDIFERTKNNRGLVEIYDRLNSFYRETMKNYMKALEYSEKEIQVSNEVGNSFLVATALNNRGNIYFDMKDYDHALEYYLKAVTIYDTLHAIRNKADIENNIGSVYVAMKEYDKAADYYQQALVLYNGLSSKADIAMCYGNMGNVYNLKGETDKGIEYTEQSLQLARQLDAKDLIAQAYSFLAEGYGKQGDFKKAFENEVALLNIKDSIFSEESAKQINDMQVKYDTEKKEKENQILALSVNRQKIITYAIAFGLLLVIGLAFFIYRGYRDKHKTNMLLEEKNKIIEEKNKDITDSINYAQRIQSAILTTPEYLKEVLVDQFVLYRPRDVVSGDFYWCYSNGSKVVFTVADCTGHGVPGAFMSMIGNSLLNEVVIENKVTDAAKILDKLRTDLLKTLQLKGQQAVTRDGMDICLCVWDKEKNELQYAGANNPLYIIRQGETNQLEENKNIKKHEGNIFEIMPDKQPIGFMEEKMGVAFCNHRIKLQKGDIIYLTSDGYADQFGGSSNKKFTKKRFRELMASLHTMPMDKQKNQLEQAFEEWKRDNEQTDDICIMGVKFDS